MVYRESDILEVVGFGFSSTPPPLSRQSKLSLFLSFFLCVAGRERGGGEGVGETSKYDREKAWLSINHSILYSYE
jgi:hypothetical protein